MLLYLPGGCPMGQLGVEHLVSLTHRHRDCYTWQPCKRQAPVAHDGLFFVGLLDDARCTALPYSDTDVSHAKYATQQITL